MGRSGNLAVSLQLNLVYRYLCSSPLHKHPPFSPSFYSLNSDSSLTHSFICAIRPHEKSQILMFPLQHQLNKQRHKQDRRKMEVIATSHVDTNKELLNSQDLPLSQASGFTGGTYSTYYIPQWPYKAQPIMVHFIG